MNVMMVIRVMIRVMIVMISDESIDECDGDESDGSIGNGYE